MRSRLITGMPAAIALRPVEVSWLPSLGSSTSALTFLLINVSTAAICCVMSLVGFTASNVTSEYWAACALALLAMAAIQPWSAAGAEKPMVTAGPDAVLAAAVGAAAAPAGAAGVLLVQALSAAPAPRPSAPSSTLRRPRSGRGDEDMGELLRWKVNRWRTRSGARGSGSARRRR